MNKNRGIQLVPATILFVTTCGCNPGGSATRPVPMDEIPGWGERHHAILNRVQRKNIDLVFLGDSITERWPSAVWETFFASRKAVNFGISGDCTQNVLWRIDHGELDGIAPKVLVLLIGTNNLGENTVEETEAGIRAVVDRIRYQLPTTKILLLGVFPRGKFRHQEYLQKYETTDPDPRVRELNARISRLANGTSVKFLDLEPTFLDDRGKIPQTLLPDFLHLSEAGYRAWAEAMEPTLSGMLK